MPAAQAAMPIYTQPGSINTRMPVTTAAGSINTRMPVTGSIQTAQTFTTVPQYTAPTVVGGYAPQYAAFNQPQVMLSPQAAYNMQAQSLQQSIQLEQQVIKQMDALKPNKEAAEKRKKARDLENKRYELQVLEMETFGSQT